MSNVLGRVNLFIVKGNPGNAKLPNNTNVLYSKKNQCNGLPKLSQFGPFFLRPNFSFLMYLFLIYTS